MYIAHKTENSEQSLEEHLKNTAETAQKFAEVFGSGNTAYLTGYLHDYGKYTDRFQRRINGENISAPHAIYGALKARKDFKDIGKLMAYCIAGHHSGLPNGNDATETSRVRGLKLPVRLCHPWQFQSHHSRVRGLKHA